MMPKRLVAPVILLLAALALLTASCGEGDDGSPSSGGTLAAVDVATPLVSQDAQETDIAQAPTAAPTESATPAPTEDTWSG